MKKRFKQPKTPSPLDKISAIYPKPLNWFYGYIIYLLPIQLVLSTLTFFSDCMKFSGIVDINNGLYMLYIPAFVFNFSAIICAFIMRQAVKELQTNAYKKIITFFIIQLAANIYTGFLNALSHHNAVYLFTYTIIGFVWFIPNTIYFSKRKSLFLGFNKSHIYVKHEKTEVKKNIPSVSSPEFIKFATMLLGALMAIAIVIQLLYVPHRIYAVEISSQNVPHYTTKYISYNWLTASTHHTFHGEIYETSSIAYDILTIQIFITILITLAIYIILQVFIKKPYILKKKQKDNISPMLLSAEQIATMHEDELKQHQERIVWYTKYNIIRKVLYIGSIVFIIGILLTAYISYSFGKNTQTSIINLNTKSTPPNPTSSNTTDPNEIRWQKIVEKVTEKENENTAAIDDKVSE